MDVEVTESAAGSFDETKQEKYPHLLSRLADYAGGVRRFEVPDEMTSWQVCIVSNKLHWISFNFFFSCKKITSYRSSIKIMKSTTTTYH